MCTVKDEPESVLLSMGGGGGEGNLFIEDDKLLHI